jgi:hypothetical protein
MHEWITRVDPKPATAATIHYCLFLGGLVEQGNLTTEELAPYAGMREVGTFLVTEVEHGNDAAGVETIATYAAPRTPSRSTPLRRTVPPPNGGCDDSVDRCRRLAWCPA